MGLFYSQEKIDAATQKFVKKIESITAMSDPADKADALVATQKEAKDTYWKIGSIAGLRAMGSIGGSVFTGLMLLGAPLLPALGVALVLMYGLALGTNGPTGFIPKESGVLQSKCAEEADNIFSSNENMKLKTAAGRKAQFDYNEKIATAFETAAKKQDIKKTVEDNYQKIKSQTYKA